MFRPHTLYIRIRIVRKVSEPAFAMKDQDVTDVIRRKQQTAMRYIGIDVSKATFVVAYSSAKEEKSVLLTTRPPGSSSLSGLFRKMAVSTVSWRRPGTTVPCCCTCLIRRDYCQHGESAEDKELRQSHALHGQD